MTFNDIDHIQWLPYWGKVLSEVGLIAFALLFALIRYVLPYYLLFLAGLTVFRCVVYCLETVTGKFADFVSFLVWRSRMKLRVLWRSILRPRSAYQYAYAESSSADDRKRGSDFKARSSSHHSSERSSTERKSGGQTRNEEERSKQEPEQKPKREESDPYSILCVARGASRDEIRNAYREQLKLSRPDRVQHLGEVLQRVAHERTLVIQRAYERLGSS